MTIIAADEQDGANTWLDLPPTARQTWSAIVVAAVVVVAFGAVVPFAGRPLATLNAFFPSLDAIVFVSDLITAVLLFAQFSISRSRSILALASGYLFTALIVIPHALTFSGAFSQTGLLGAGPQTGSWLFIFWHFGFAATLFAYALLRDENRAKSSSGATTLPAIGWSVATVLGLVCSLTWLATKGATLLPIIVLDNNRLSPFVIYPVSLTMLIAATALIVLLFRQRSVLDRWLVVVALVYIGELAFSGLFPSVRFSVGFYAGRVFALITSSIVLTVLMAETMRLYVQLARSNAMLRAERNNKLMNLEAMVASISHEVRQPLSIISVSGSAALRFLERTSPNLEEARSTLNLIVAESHRASQVFDNIRALFGRAGEEHEPVDVNEITLEVLHILGGDLSDHGVTLRTELMSERPLVMGHRGQLQEVLLNLVRNAIEAMDAVKGGSRMLLVRTERHDSDKIFVAVEDSGPGINPKKLGGIFDAFVSTKPQGMGLGLAICRMIIERHGGQFSAWSGKKRGAVFQFILPATKA
jgi:signal transduction histidine kinase